MPTKVIVRTPKGEFPSVQAAAAAHGVDRSTISKRCTSDPENYSRTEYHVPSTKSKAKETWVVRGVRWPISWAQYRQQDFETKEEIWLDWCKQQGLDPDLESTVDAFFEAMDNIENLEPIDTADEEIQDDEQQERTV